MKDTNWILIILVFAVFCRLWADEPLSADTRPTLERISSPVDLARLKVRQGIPAAEIASDLNEQHTGTLIDSLIASSLLEKDQSDCARLLKVAEAVDQPVFKNRLNNHTKLLVEEKKYKEAGYLLAYCRIHHADWETLKPADFVAVFQSQEFAPLLNTELARNAWMYFNAATVITKEEWKPYPAMKEITEDYLKWVETLDVDLMKIKESLLRIRETLK